MSLPRTDSAFVEDILVSAGKARKPELLGLLAEIQT